MGGKKKEGSKFSRIHEEQRGGRGRRGSGSGGRRG
jgi:hypothetical protein